MKAAMKAMAIDRMHSITKKEDWKKIWDGLQSISDDLKKDGFEACDIKTFLQISLTSLMESCNGGEK